MQSVERSSRAAGVSAACLSAKLGPTEHLYKTAVGEYWQVADLKDALEKLAVERDDLAVSLRLMAVPGNNPPWPVPMPNPDPAGGVLEITASGSAEAMALVRKLIDDMMKTV